MIDQERTRFPATDEDETVRAAIYARTSSEKQTHGYSLDKQVEKASEHCDRLGWRVQFVYRDRAESGKDTDRPMFQEMLRGAELDFFDVVVFWKLDRFSRSLMHAVQLESDLREYDVGLYSVTEQIDTTSPAGRFNFRNIASAAEFERDMIQQRTEMGLRALAEDHKWPNDSPPLGYETCDDDTLRVDEDEAELVEWIFRTYLEERSMPEVAQRLNDRGITTAADGEWTPRAVGDVLGNELYTGRYQVSDVDEQVEDYRIISDDLFEEVTAVRHRFRSDREAQSMPASRKERLICGMVDEYATYLDSCG